VRDEMNLARLSEVETMSDQVCVSWTWITEIESSYCNPSFHNSRFECSELYI
jgi:hypothetical protein